MTSRCAVTDFVWERINVTIGISVPPELDGWLGSAGQEDLSFVLVDQERELPVASEYVGGGRHLIRINVTNFADRKQLPNGAWRFVPVVGDRRGRAAGFDLNELPKLDEASRNYI